MTCVVSCTNFALGWYVPVFHSIAQWRLMGCSLYPSGWVFWLWFLFLVLPWWVDEGSRQLCLIVFCLVGVIFAFYGNGIASYGRKWGVEDLQNRLGGHFAIVVRICSCFSGKSDSIPCFGPGVAPGSFFSGGIVLCLSGNDRFSQWPPLCWFVVLLWLIPIQVWCWALLFPSHDWAWSWVGFGLFGLMVRVCWLILHFHWGRWLLCCHCFLSSLWFPSCH